MLQALGFLMLFAGDLLLMEASTSSAELCETLPLGPRRSWESVLYRSGVAEWCARLGAPLEDSDGVTLGFGIGPFPGPLEKRTALVLSTEFGATGAELTASDARRELATVASQSFPVYRGALARLADGVPFDEDYRGEIARFAVSSLRTARVAGPHVLRGLALDDGASRRRSELSCCRYLR